ncbi:TSUP family transporter [Chroococcidiopsis sp. TS-821]|uniref:TSUP family transporter n=1 Tax=Chroococcidiopsis sp. TS-821 TaxID=1378066 RepID=UPI00352D7E31
MTQIISLCLFAFLAGLIDSVVGGGGLIQLPALFIILPNTALPLLLGTNKLASIAGTFVAFIRFSLQIKMNFAIVTTAAIAAFIFSFIGAKTVSIINPNLLRPLVLLILIAVAIYTFIKKDFGTQHKFHEAKTKIIYAVIIGASIGFYDGFLGPGTGSFLIFAFIGIIGFDFLRASASAKVVNFCTNLAALVYFIPSGNVIYNLAIPMAICNIGGAIIGTKLAILKGNKFIRNLFLIIVSTLIFKLAYDIVFS